MGIRQNIVRQESLMVNYTVVNDWTVVEVDGGMDIHTAPMVRDAVMGLMDEGHEHFVLDLGFVTFMDSTGLGAIIAVTKRISEESGSLRIASASNRILRVFEVTGLRANYDFRPSAEEAINSAPVRGSAAPWPYAG
ncbi:anti-sigma B factor antagonist [Catenulispora sp. MAP5-51]|uniref:STAS domain-containing protein n=1 Tax=Catenulispora sp. MAP5-51 TaxID=3156298 RepID=UPI0035166241